MTQDHKDAQAQNAAVTIYVRWMLSTPANSVERKRRIKTQVMDAFVAGAKHGLKFAEIKHEEHAPANMFGSLQIGISATDLPESLSLLSQDVKFEPGNVAVRPGRTLYSRPTTITSRPGASTMQTASATQTAPTMQTAPTTYSVIVRDAYNFDAVTGISLKLATCGHRHQTTATAYACKDKLRRSRNGMTAEEWYYAEIEGSDGVTPDYDPR